LVVAALFPAQAVLAAQRTAKQVRHVNTGPNTEQDDRSGAPGSSGFSISIDGKAIAGSRPVSPQAPVTADKERIEDLALEAADIAVTFDGLDARPVLNVATSNLRRAYRSGDTVRFVTSSNYSDFIDHAEIRIVQGGAPFAVLPANANGVTAWTMPDGSSEDEFSYVLRVYDGQNRYDETAPLTLIRTDREFETHETTTPIPPFAAGWGEDRTAFRNIPVHGGSVTVHAKGLQPGDEAFAFGDPMPVDAAGNAVARQIVPAGLHTVDVAIHQADGSVRPYSRDVTIPKNDFFYVALADLTIGKRFASADVESAEPDRYGKVWNEGRLAFYLKGKIRGRVLLTASADTGSKDVRALFNNLDEKDPRSLLKRIDPDDYYPVYGDDSTSINDAPTNGRLYVRLERDDSHAMWGTFKAGIADNHFLNNDRTLNGAQVVLRSPSVTSFGERRFDATAYAAQPGTLPQRDILRATGGSAYFLKRQDISKGSETITVVVADPTSGRILSRSKLSAGAEYEIDYAQGIVILTAPLASTTDDDRVIRKTAVGANEVSLVVAYEYSPPAGQIDGYSYGGRAQAWLDDHVRVGATGMSETTGPADQHMASADVMLRHSETTYLKGEYAVTRGPGFGKSLSTDGGLTITDIASAGTAKTTGTGIFIEGQVDLSDFDAALNARFGGHYEEMTAGFASLDHDITVGQRSWGLFGEYEPTDALTLRGEHEDFSDKNGKRRTDTSAEVTYQIAENWKARFGVTYTALATPGGKLTETGDRVDLGGRLEWTPQKGTKIYGFAQGTVARSGGIRRNDRIGLGGETLMTEKIGVAGEVSTGTTGLGAIAAITYDPTPDDHYYVGYKLDPDRAWRDTAFNDTDLGAIVVGSKRRFNDVLTGFAENSYDMYGKKRSLTSTYGVTWTPDAKWTVSGGLELGRVRDPNASDFDRRALSMSLGYRDGERLAARLRGEARFESSDDKTRDRQTYLLVGGLMVKVSDDWRLVANADAVVSNSDQSSILDGDYVEASVGFAYRPVNHDRLNMLFKYTWLYDLPGADQVNANGSVLGPAQRSHVLSVDGNYDLNRFITVGAKYGFRFGQVSSDRTLASFSRSSAHLGILRADLHVVHNWDVLVEGRVFHLTETRQTDWGALTAVYRHFGNNFKVGVGYNFGRFSDDLTDLVQDDQGVFLNVVGKF
jgi:hypothetical protein